VRALIVWDVASYRQTRSPLDCDPTKRQPSLQHDEACTYVDVSVVGTVIDVHRPVSVRYSPFEVPIATHVLSVVHATFDNGTEMLIAGRPVTTGVTITGVVPHDAKTMPAALHRAVTRTRERARAGTRIIVSLRS
jgi:hypothetical protein